MVETTSVSKTFQGNGSSTEFPVTDFVIMASTDLSVVLVSSDGSRASLTQGVDFSVDYNTATRFFTVTYPLSGDPLSSTESLEVSRATPIVQSLNLDPSEKLQVENIERFLDKTVCQMQESKALSAEAVSVKTDVQDLVNDATAAAAVATASASGVSSAKIAAEAAQTAAEEAAATAVGLVSAAEKIPSNVSSVEIGYLDGVTSSIQSQLNSKAPTASPNFTGQVTIPDATEAENPVAYGQLAGLFAASSDPYFILPNGKIVQHFTVTESQGADGYRYFPIAFPTQCDTIVVSGSAALDSEAMWSIKIDRTKFRCGIGADYVGLGILDVIAIGR